MSDEMMPKPVNLTKNDNTDFQLTARERRLISNFRAVRASAQNMLYDLAEQYKYTLPAVPTTPQI